MMATSTVCQRCHVPVRPGARFCANCGADVSAEQGNVPTRQFTATQTMHDELLARVRHAALGEYEILAELGRGGMATVYLAHDIQLDRKVALKVMLPSLLEGEDMIERFRLEARTAAQLSHPHIIPIYAVRTAENLVYFVMKFVEGRPLDAIVRELGKLPIPMVRSIVSKVGEALGYAHRRGVVHRDIKPANLMIDVEGLPVVTDFGIAKVADARAITMTGAMIGTPTYMSPEQCSAGEISGASDQYSLGVVAYQLITGKVPFEADSMVGLLYKHLHEAPAPLTDSRADCPRSLNDSVLRMLAKEPAQRFPTMEAAVAAVGTVSLAYDDPMRSQLIGLARAGENVSLLRRVSTPASPMPPRARPPMPASASAPPEAATPAEATSAARPALAGVGPTRRGRLYSGLVVGLVAAALMLFLRPWDRVGPPTPAPEPEPTGAPAVVAPPPAPRTTEPSAPEGTKSGEANPAPVAALRITSAPASLTVGESATLRALALASGDSVLAGRAIAWTSSDAARATITPAGRLTARAPGEVTVRAQAGGVSRSVSVEVLPARAASLAVAPTSASLTVGGATRLIATPRDAGGRPVPSAVSWRSADPRVATVSDGVVTAVGAGSTVIAATADGREEEVNVRVVAAEVAQNANAPVRTDRPAAEPPPAAPAAPREPTPAESRAAVEAVVQRYARALESGQLPEVRAIYPGITPEQEAQVSQMRFLQKLRVVLRVGSLSVVGSEVTAAVSGEYEFYSPENRRTEHLPVQFTATLVREGSSWQIRSIR
ncbi:MAG: protein kinase domain-containing protein [Gemmatimonadaceae bacterium]